MGTPLDLDRAGHVESIAMSEGTVRQRREVIALIPAWVAVTAHVYLERR